MNAILTSAPAATAWLTEVEHRLTLHEPLLRARDISAADVLRVAHGYARYSDPTGLAKAATADIMRATGMPSPTVRRFRRLLVEIRAARFTDPSISGGNPWITLTLPHAGTALAA